MKIKKLGILLMIVAVPTVYVAPAYPCGFFCFHWVVTIGQKIVHTGENLVGVGSSGGSGGGGGGSSSSTAGIIKGIATGCTVIPADCVDVFISPFLDEAATKGRAAPPRRCIPGTTCYCRSHVKDYLRQATGVLNRNSSSYAACAETTPSCTRGGSVAGGSYTVNFKNIGGTHSSSYTNMTVKIHSQCNYTLSCTHINVDPKTGRLLEKHCRSHIKGIR